MEEINQKLFWRRYVYAQPCFSVSRASGVFAFSDFTACNAVVGVEGDWRKLVYRQTPLTANENLEKIEITKRVFTVFFSTSSTEQRSTRSEFSLPSIYSVDHKNKKGAEFFGGFKIII